MWLTVRRCMLAALWLLLSGIMITITTGKTYRLRMQELHGTNGPCSGHQPRKYSNSNAGLTVMHNSQPQDFTASVVAADGDSEEKSEAMKAAVKNTIITMSAGLLFGFGTWALKGKQPAMEYFTAFLVEKSLSIDNLFVFLMLFDYFQIPYKLQNRVLTWGLLGAVAMRGVMIFVGVQAIQRFRSVTLIFAGILIASAYKLFMEDDAEADPSENAVMKLSKMIMPAADYLDGEKFFTLDKKGTGRKLATPLLTCLICIELSDFVFAVDSIPAVIGISKDPFIVYSSNIFAILGLRSLYILISRAVSELRYIRPSVATVLGFVGAKMVAEYFHFEISAVQSLLVILTILATGLIASIRANQVDRQQQNNK